MTKQYFGDILECGDKRMDYEVEKPWKVDDIKLMTFKAKSAPSKETSISHGTDMVRAKEPGTYEFKHKSELKTTMHDNDVKLTISNKDFTLQSEWEPADLNKDGQHSSIDVEAKCTPAKDDWEAKVEFKIGGMKVGPMVPWTEFQLDTNKAQEHMLTYY